MDASLSAQSDPEQRLANASGVKFSPHAEEVSMSRRRPDCLMDNGSMPVGFARLTNSWRFAGLMVGFPMS